MPSAQAHPLAGEPDVDTLVARTLVPLKDLSASQLQDLLSGVQSEVVFAGQPLFQAGEYDGQHVYLLHGEVRLIDADGSESRIKGRATLMPLAHRQPRAVTAEAVTDCSVLRLNSERLDERLTWSQVADYLRLNIARRRDLDEDGEWISTLLQSNLFFKVPPLNVEQILYRLTPRVVYAGETVIRQGEMGRCCYFIKEGQAEVHRHEEQRWTHLAVIGPGRCFGEDALVNDAPRNARVRMLTDGVLMELDKQDFYRLLRAPEVPTLTLSTLQAVRERGAVLVDTRSEEEYNHGHLQGAVNIPLGLLAIKSRLLSDSQEYLCYCDTGRRSRATAHLLRQQGYRAHALDNDPPLFSKPVWADELEDTTPYVLKEGRASRERS
ncbi:cyclic nucleotide-binding domain-containing protein [Marinimicrobium sp. ARAG 43.8]|uniref:cyclic nucleotide-binding domain-containing protein n=1 Tax=Marinimicrobium sp. ARAG 43.8 TaxID=3418719 RepID=UPI003CED3305